MGGIRRGDGVLSLRLATRGPEGRLAFWVVWGAIALMPALLAIVALLRAMVGTPGACEASRTGMVGFSVACGGLAFWLGRSAVRGIVVAAQARRLPGAVMLEPDGLVLDVPWWSTEPVRIPKQVVDEIGARDHSLTLNGDLALGFRMGPTVVHFAEPIGFPTAVDVEVPLRSPVWPPRSTDAVTSISLAFEEQSAADQALERWLREPGRGRAGPPPQPLPSRFEVPWSTVVAWLLVAGGGVVVWASLPSGC